MSIKSVHLAAHKAEISASFPAQQPPPVKLYAIIKFVKDDLPIPPQQLGVFAQASGDGPIARQRKIDVGDASNFDNANPQIVVFRPLDARVEWPSAP